MEISSKIIHEILTPDKKHKARKTQNYKNKFIYKKTQNLKKRIINKIWHTPVPFHSLESSKNIFTYTKLTICFVRSSLNGSIIQINFSTRIQFSKIISISEQQYYHCKRFIEYKRAKMS